MQSGITKKTTFMPNYSRNDLILIKFPFSDLSSSKVRPAIVINSSHSSHDLIVVSLTSKTQNLREGEFILTSWQAAGLNIETAVKRGIFTVHENLILRKIGKLGTADASNLDNSLLEWLQLSRQ